MKLTFFYHQLVFLILMALLATNKAVAQNVQGTEYTSPADSSLYTFPIKNYKLWIPDGVTNVRGIIITPDYNDDRQIYYNDTMGYRQLAKKYNLAIMLYQVFNFGTTDVKKVCNEILNKALPDFATQSGHPEIKYSCFIPMGLSWGGDCACQLANAIPERIITYVPLHSTDDLSVKQEDFFATKSITPLTGNAITLEVKAKTSSVNIRAGALIVKGDLADWDPFIAFLNGFISVWDDKTSPLQTLTPNTWYNFKVVMNTNTRKFDVYIDGKLMRSGTDHKQTYVSGIVLGFNTAGSVTYDNVKISSGDTIYFEENFNKMTSGKPPVDWTFTNESGIISVIDEPDSSNKSVRFTKSDAPDKETYLSIPSLSEEADRDNFMPFFPQVDAIAVSVMPMREKHALAAGYIMSETHHPWVAYQSFNQLWIKTILNFRVPATVPADKVVKMKAMQETTGYLGKLEYHKLFIEGTFDHLVIDKKEIFKYDKFPYPKTEGHWLPNAEIAEAWLQMLTNRTIPAKLLDWMNSK